LKVKFKNYSQQKDAKLLELNVAEATCFYLLASLLSKLIYKLFEHLYLLVCKFHWKAFYAAIKTFSHFTKMEFKKYAHHFFFYLIQKYFGRTLAIGWHNLYGILKIYGAPKISNDTIFYSKMLQFSPCIK
jgi:hypothetical protein